jgi:hypothetical protein
MFQNNPYITFVIHFSCKESDANEKKNKSRQLDFR